MKPSSLNETKSQPKQRLTDLYNSHTKEKPFMYWTIPSWRKKVSKSKNQTKDQDSHTYSNLFYVKNELVFTVPLKLITITHYRLEKQKQLKIFYLGTKSNCFLLWLNRCIIVNCPKFFYFICLFLLKRWPE